MLCALGTLALACDHRDEGRSYGLATGDGRCTAILKGTAVDSRRGTVHVVDNDKLEHGPPAQMEGWVDATWSLLATAPDTNVEGLALMGESVSSADEIALAVTINGGAVHCTVRLQKKKQP